MTKSIISQSELKQVLHYEPESGLFTSKIKTKYLPCGHIYTGCEGHGYINITINSVIYKGHHLAWLYVYGEWPKYRITNIRQATHHENMMNCKKSKNNSSGVTGVQWDKARGKWIAVIMVNYKNIHLGRYIYIFDAICARKSAEHRYGFHKNHGR